MSVFFLHPLYLLGLAAASLPILIHLLNRRRLKRIQFPAVRFILLSQKRISRSYRLRHWLLLALRTFAIILLALLLANPIFQTGAGLFAGSGPVSLVLLLDNSLSMTWSGDGNGFKQAKEAARLFLSSLDDGDRAAVIPTNHAANEIFRLKPEKQVLLKELDAVEIADGSANLSDALAKAYDLLKEPASQKEIRLITDMGVTGWDEFSISALKRVDPSVQLKIIRIPSKGKPLNGTVKAVRLGGQGVGVNLPVNIEATLANFGDSEIKDLLVQLSIDGQTKEQKLASIPGRGETAVTFQTSLAQPGSHTGEVRLKKDGFAGNAATYFALEAQDKLRILLVDGDPQTSLTQSETFFIARALNPAGDRDSSLYLPAVILADALGATSLESYEVVVLCNVAVIPDSFVQKLQDFLRQGGGVLIFSGDRVQTDGYQKLARSSPPLLPPLHDRKVGPEANGEKIARVDVSHPALQGLSDALLQESLKSARIWGYTRTTAPAGSVLMTLANGDPLLVEQKVGTGRVLYAASSADRDWNDLPVKTAYLPWIQGLANYLAGGKRGSMDGGISVGSVKEITLPPSYVGKTLRITKPNRQDSEAPIEAAKDRSVASFNENDRAGIYRIALPTGGEKATGTPQLYAVNPPFLESRLDQITEAEVRAKLKPVVADVVSVDTLQQGGKRMDLAFPLVALLIITLLLEGWLAQRF